MNHSCRRQQAHMQRPLQRSMTPQLRWPHLLLALAASVLSLTAAAQIQLPVPPTPTEAPVPGPVDRLPDGRPDLSGNWSLDANLSDIRNSMVRIGNVEVSGDARVIPYTPVYAQLRAETSQRMYEEPELHCYMPGVPSHMWRQAYSGAGLVVQQNASHVVFLHEFQGARRIVRLDAAARPIPDAIKLFMGDGIGHFDGDTLVIETRNHNGITWLDLAGNRHSDQFVVTERFTPVNNDAWRYEATFSDPVAYTDSWTIAAWMLRGPDPDAEILEFACIEGNTDHLHYTEEVGGSSQVQSSQMQSSQGQSPALP